MLQNADEEPSGCRGTAADSGRSGPAAKQIRRVRTSRRFDPAEYQAPVSPATDVNTIETQPLLTTAQTSRRIVAGPESEVHDEPHITDSRLTVRFVHERVEDGDLDPAAFADQYGVDIADVYHALAYYHEHPGEMRRVEERRASTIEANRDGAITGPDDV